MDDYGGLPQQQLPQQMPFSQMYVQQAYPTQEAAPGDSKMNEAYKISSALLRDRLDKDEQALLDTVVADDVIVVTGTYDHIHKVLQAIGTPFKQINPQDILRMEFRPDQIIYVNCPSSFPEPAAKKLAGWVHSGGLLITTDWALKHVIEVGFPGTAKYNGQSTADTVVPVEILDTEDDIVKGFLDEDKEAAPQWWLEGSSYPIQVLDKEKVKVLMKSDELKRQYGEDPVIIRIQWGSGQVYHMISHFYLQRSETRNEKHKTSASNYGISKGGSETTVQMMSAANLDYGTVQSAYTSTEVVSRAVLKQKKKYAKS